MLLIEGGKKYLKYFATYLAIAGLFTFSLFILEESFQTLMFSSWPAQDAQRWDLVLKSTDLMETANDTLEIVNWCFGFIQPLAFISYRSYAISEEMYIEALRAKAFAHAPELFIGRTVTVGFNPQRSERTDDGRKWRLVNGRVRVEVDELPKTKTVFKTGKVVLEGDKIIIK